MNTRETETIIKNQGKLSRELKINIEEYLNAARLIIKRLEDRRMVNAEFLSEIEEFIEYAREQVKNENLSSEVKHHYLDLIEEEKSLHDRIQKDLKRNNELIKSIKKSTEALFR
jgi:hypothetical protein